MDKKSQFLYQFRAFFVNSNSIPIPFFSIPIPSPIPGIESGIELNSHSILELTPALSTITHQLLLKHHSPLQHAHDLLFQCFCQFSVILALKKVGVGKYKDSDSKPGVGRIFSENASAIA